MYRKKNRMPLIVTIISIAVLVLLLAALTFFRNRKQRAETTDSITHEALIYKASGGNIEFDKSYLVSENNTEVVLSIEEDSMMTFVVKPLLGKVFDGLSINETSNINNEVSYLVNDAEGNDKRVNFVMPKMDVIINLKFIDEEELLEDKEVVEEETQKTEEVQSETIETSPYNLTLHGLTASILASYDNQFDDVKFLTSLGDDLHINSAVSEYRMVTDVTFSDEAYDGEGAKDTDKVFHMIYFNNDPNWKMLSTYYKRDKEYVFSEIVEEESEETEKKGETEDITIQGQPGGISGGLGSSNTYSGSYPQSGSGSQSQSVTSFDIMQVSKTFLRFTGDEDRFYEECFQYVLLKGLTGEIVGTMSSYEISPENEKASFTIMLSTGGRIEGTYSRKKNAYSFRGL